MQLDLEKIQRIFTRRGERVVLVLPSGEAVVLVPLTEYEQLVPGPKPTAQPQPAVTPAPRRGPGRPPAVHPLEAIDPPQGQLPDDDQYFPEPLE